MSSVVLAADVPVPPAPAAALPVPNGWTFQFTPYAWLTGVSGTQTVRGRSAKVNASFWDIVEKSDTLIGLMGDFEARNGPISLFADLVWVNIGADRSHIRSRSFLPGATGTVGRSLDLDIDMAIVEVGAAYEVWRSGAVAFDLLAGARYWYQSAELSFESASTADVGDLERVGGRAFAKSGSVDWLDPLVGARLRWTVAPGQALFLRGDVGGFGLGSKTSWQAIGGYSFDIGSYGGVTFSGVIGYRALYVDYAQGEGRRRYEFDMLQHGPVVGVSMRF